MNKFIAMNRFKIAVGRESDFEYVWRNRETYLEGVKGFQEFNLLKGFTNEEYTLFILPTVHGILELILKIGKNQRHLEKHCSGGSQHKGIYLSHPKFEGFEVVL